MKGHSKHGLAIAVSRTHTPLFRTLVPFEPSPPSASAVLKQEYLTLLINAFATSVLLDTSTSFTLRTLIEWLTKTNTDEMMSHIANVAHEFNREVEQYAIDRCRNDGDVFLRLLLVVVVVVVVVMMMIIAFL